MLHVVQQRIDLGRRHVAVRRQIPVGVEIRVRASSLAPTIAMVMQQRVDARGQQIRVALLEPGGIEQPGLPEHTDIAQFAPVDRAILLWIRSIHGPLLTLQRQLIARPPVRAAQSSVGGEWECTDETSRRRRRGHRATAPGSRPGGHQDPRLRAASQPHQPRPDLDHRHRHPQLRLHGVRHAVWHRRPASSAAADGRRRHDR